MGSPTIVSSISEHIESLLGISIASDRNIYLGDSNIAHMIRSHPSDYSRYGAHIPSILSSPDYVGINPGDGSIEYIKEFSMDGKFVKVAVRISAGNKYYARSIYSLNNNRVNNFIRDGKLIKV